MDKTQRLLTDEEKQKNSSDPIFFGNPKLGESPKEVAIKTSRKKKKIRESNPKLGESSKELASKTSKKAKKNREIKRQTVIPNNIQWDQNLQEEEKIDQSKLAFSQAKLPMECLYQEIVDVNDLFFPQTDFFFPHTMKTKYNSWKQYLNNIFFVLKEVTFLKFSLDLIILISRVF